MRGAIHPLRTNPASFHSVSTTLFSPPLIENTVLADVVESNVRKVAGVKMVEMDSKILLNPLAIKRSHLQVKMLNSSEMKKLLKVGSSMMSQLDFQQP